jgi:hypothetical protein
MKRKDEIKYHKVLLEIINKIKKPKKGRLISKSAALSGLKAQFKPYEGEFKIEFRYDIFRKGRVHLDVGQIHRKVEIQFSDATYILESVFLGIDAPPHFTGFIDRIHSKGFSERKKYYYQLVIPLEKKLEFHFQIQQTNFRSDLGYYSRNATTATISGDTLQACCIDNGKKEYFLVIDSAVKQNFDEFSEKASAMQIALGYLSGYYAGNQGYFFVFTSKKKSKPKHFRVIQFRPSIKSGFTPIHSNSYGYLPHSALAMKYENLLRNVSLIEFSTLCERIYCSREFSSSLILILESSVASLLFRPGGYAIALETLSDLIVGKRKLKLSPIKEPSVSRNIRKGFLEVLNRNKSTIATEDIETLRKRIDQFNQRTNKMRLQAPFNLLTIAINHEDLKILETRNDFLHGRVPDLTNSGTNRSIERINKDLYYCSMRFYTLLNMIILKWIGYSNRVVNFPKLYEEFTQISLDEEPFREVERRRNSNGA